MNNESKYVIGIDLGTSNCVCSYSTIDDINNSGLSNYSLLKFTQAVDEETIESLDILPSCIYLPEKTMVSELQGQIPTIMIESDHINESKWIPGEIAKRKILELPERVVQSAKSWLSVESLNRHQKILPWDSELVEDQKLSPVTAQAILLSYIKETWDRKFGKVAPFVRQKIAITVPASFTEEASKLTLQAATMAEYPLEALQILDEPQAALFANIENIASTLSKIKELRPVILVCDIGGGTTDFSLYAYSKDSPTPFERIKIGPHLLLGGDNIDLAIAHRIHSEHNLSLPPKDFAKLIYESRLIKEDYFSKSSLPEELSIALLENKGSKLFTNTLTIKVSPTELFQDIKEGFFPSTINTPDYDSPNGSINTSGISEFGLPYCSDPRITFQLQEFIEKVPVHGVLYNGGSMETSRFREIITDHIANTQGFPPLEIQSKSLSASVAEGAARFLKIRHSKSKEQNPVKAGYPRNLYILVEDELQDHKAVCILEKGEEREHWITLQAPLFNLRVNEECKFVLLASQKRLDHYGDLVTIDESLKQVAILESIIERSNPSDPSNDTGEVVKVQLEIKIDSLRIINLRLKEMDVIDAPQSWPLTFAIGKQPLPAMSPRTDLNQTQNLTEKIEPIITALYGKSTAKHTTITPKDLIRELEQRLKCRKDDWDLAIIRAISDICLPLSSKRSRSPQHEIAWLQLVGFCFRPGFGYPGDEDRMEQVRATLRIGLFFKKEKLNRQQWAIFWRRIAGGLSQDIQEKLFEDTLKELKKENFTDPEACRLIASLESVSQHRREELVDSLLALTQKPKKLSEAVLWSVARLSARFSMRDTDSQLLPLSATERIIRTLLAAELDPGQKKYTLRLLISAQEVRMDRHDISIELREELLRQCVRLSIPTKQQDHEPDSSEKSAKEILLYGDDLPIGLALA